MSASHPVSALPIPGAVVPDPAVAPVAAAQGAAPEPSAAPAPSPATPAKPKSARAGWLPRMPGAVGTAAAAGALCGAMVGGLVVMAALMVSPSSSRQVATIDLQTVIELQQLKLTAMVLKPGATDDDKARAFTQVKAFGEALDQAIERVRKGCDCVLLTRTAVVGSHSLDMTSSLKRELGLADADADAWRKIAMDGIGRTLPLAETLRSSMGSTAPQTEFGVRK